MRVPNKAIPTIPRIKERGRRGGANKVHEKREAKGRAFRVQAMKEKRTEITLRFGRRHIDDAIERPEPAGGERLLLLRAPCAVQCNFFTPCPVLLEGRH